jgi:hypothetical protein
VIQRNPRRINMATKKAGKKKVTKKRASLADDPPIIVGGGSSEIIQIRADLLVSPMPPAGSYNRFRVAGVNIRYVDVDGSNHGVDPATNKVRFLERIVVKRGRK